MPETRPVTDPTPDELRLIQRRLERFMLEYEFALREVETIVGILSDEFAHMHDYNPIEHVSGRVKSADSIMAKVARKGLAPPGALPDLDIVRASVTDIAGIRVTCSFVDDAYRLFDLLTRHPDITVLQVKDYIAEPKPSGYKSLHAVVETPVLLSTGRIRIPVEIQFRTVAMDFWASLEHKIHYKFDGEVPERLQAELRDVAQAAADLDARMLRVHREVHGMRSSGS